MPQLALEADGAGNLLRRYLYGARRISMTTPAGSFYYHYDSTGSVADVTSSTGASEWTYAYEPFGTIRVATQNDPNVPDNPMQFTGEYADATDLYDLRARQYDPCGRALQHTRSGHSSGTQPEESSYSYAGDRPTFMVDPSAETRIPTSESAEAAMVVTSVLPTHACLVADPARCLPLPALARQAASAACRWLSPTRTRA